MSEEPGATGAGGPARGSTPGRSPQAETPRSGYPRAGTSRTGGSRKSQPPTSGSSRDRSPRRGSTPGGPARRGLLSRYRKNLGNETFAGMVLLAGAAVALVWANSPWRATYHTIADHVIGPESLHLALPVGSWASDGLLALFFFVVGLELKTEFVTGSLRDIRLALVPMIAAVLGMAGPALVNTLVQAVSGSGTYAGWAIPVATDIAFAVAVLGIFGRGFPPAVRTFLLTLAVVDDLLGITVIAVFYTEQIHFLLLGASLALIALFALLVQPRVTRWWLLVPVAVVAWALMHASGVHATVAGVLMGLTVPALAGAGERSSLTHRLTAALQPWSAGVVLPIFAFFAAGVSVVDSGGLGGVLTDPVAIGVYLALPLGKLLGIWGGVAVLLAVTRLRLGEGVRLADLVPVGLLAGIGFTVSLLIATLSFDAGSPEVDHARVGVILGSLISAVLGAVALRIRAWRRLEHLGSAHLPAG
ncbi:Na+/H+ antiporter NhaA [Georgenia sp. TF02-10]|uniref:Na+/H+ antiporter NhaA n=1 Tax=Georgenia sp. TF02-10 TaxID=2917725 RepID=UPI001FA80D64|nr:Na+/H+ antiporter NhaA [Georgenia sp. TF02-10]UNX55606.1 Na+/H+ antiporter NhaA [Georgenia sp. TF02-10]